jgi:hypothetical protein
MVSRLGFTLSGVLFAMATIAAAQNGGTVSAQPPDGTVSAPQPARPRAPRTFGPYASYVTVGEWEFTSPFTSWTWGDTTFSQPLKYSTIPNGHFNASPHIPTGARLTFLEFDYCDDNPTQDITLRLTNTDYLNNVIYLIGQVSSTGMPPGCRADSVDLTPLGFHVDNYNQRLLLQASFGTNADSTTRFAGAIVGYQLEPSPAPGYASFNDVPEGHPFHQFVEALYASGITAGCGSGNFCPDAPLTRGQMAVFLSKALGLYWQY